MRQFVAEVMPDAQGCIAVSGKKFHYVRSVLRIETGDMMYVRLPDGALQQMTVARIDDGSKTVILTVAGDESFARSAPVHDVLENGSKAPPVNQKPPVSLWLFQFIAKPPKMELIIRQAVECGVSVIVPVMGEFCQSGCIESARKRTAASDTRWQRIITEAREQSGSPVDTRIAECVTVDEACRLWQKHVSAEAERSDGMHHAFAAVLYEQSAKTMLFHEAFGRALESNVECNAAAVMVGAEGGISPSELELVSQNGFVPVHFKTNILRCETAALYGLAVLQNTITESAVWQLKK